jgi:hypothetical protein
MTPAQLAQMLRDLAKEVETRNLTSLDLRVQILDQSYGRWKAGEAYAVPVDDWTDAHGVRHIAHIKGAT